MTKQQKAILLVSAGVAIVIAALALGYSPEEVGTLIRALAACLVGAI